MQTQPRTTHEKKMRAVRFELTHLSIAELKSAALDHSAKLADIREQVLLIIYIIYSSYWSYCAVASTLAELTANKVLMIVIRVLVKIVYMAEIF